jgi:molybdopterin/thiamine biosynthesis adenylyltransferase/rhodanese-related sulfurtransferase
MTGFHGGGQPPLAEAIPEASLDDVRSIVASSPATGAEAREPLVIDVREQHEWDAGHIPNTVHVPRGELASRIEALVPERSRPLVMSCLSGARSFAAARTLRSMGYTNVSNFAGSFQAWSQAGLPVETASRLTDAQRRRYSRHLLIPEVGIDGQQRLLDSKVLLIGAGGLGSPAALYLAAAGVGTLGLVDFDVVDESNLQRQVLHTTDRIGTKKIESAAQTIGALNPDVRVIGYDEVLGDDNVDRIIAGYDVILDGTDTFEVRYTLNDAAVRAGIPVVHASVFRFEGQTTVFAPGVGPCYRCLYPTPPPPELAPGCAVAGVLGVVPGIMGLLETNEILKLLLGVGEPLIGRLLIFDALDASFTELKLRRDPECPACSHLWTDDGRADARRWVPAEPVVAGAGAGAAAGAGFAGASSPIQLLDRPPRA